MFRRRATWLIACAVLCLPNLARGQAIAAPAAVPATAPADTSHAERCLAGIDLAIIAAEAGIVDVSFEAMRRATTKGPPVAAIELGGLLSNKAATRVRSTANAPSREQEADLAQIKVAKRLQRLSEIWQKRQVDPAEAYAAFKSLVLPEARPNEAFCYAVSLSSFRTTSYSDLDFNIERPKPIDCGAAALVEWARRAKREDDLLAEVEKRAKMPTAASAAFLIKVLLAQDPSRSAELVPGLCEALAPQAKLLVNGPDSELLLGSVWKVLERVPADAPPRQKLLDAVCDATAREQNWSNNRWLVYLVIDGMREALEAGNEPKFRKYVDVALSIYTPIRANNAEYVASREAVLYAEAARRAFEAGHLKLAAECLRTQAKLPAPERYLESRADTFLDPTQPVLQNLLKLDRAERFELLNSLVWLMPQLGLVRSARMNAADRVPALFAAGATVPSQALPWRDVARENARSVSLLEWTMREGVALGKQATIEAEIAKLEASGSDDAKLARLSYALAQGKPMDLALATKTDKGIQGLAPVLGDNGRVTPLDVEIVEQALASPQHRKLGERLADKLLNMAMSEHQDLFVTLVRDIKARLNDKPPAATHDDLVHWTVADDVAEADYAAGHLPASLWVKRDDKNTWGQQFGTDYSVLMLRYPLAGDFTISFRARDAQYREGAATFGGRLIEFLQYRGGLQISGLGKRSTSMVETDALVKNRFNAIRLIRKGDTLTVHVADKFHEELAVPAGEFPFFGLGANHFHETSFDSLAIEGDVTIPRSVDLLAPSLAGWSARFKGERLPALALLPEHEPPADDDKITYDWRLVDGALESIDRTSDGKPAKSKQARPQREALIRYLRPLGDGEQISLEFFHEPGKRTIAPALGRIAMLLDGGKVALHWITTDPAGIVTGVDDANRALDAQADELQTVALKDNDWNQLTLKLDGDVLTLAINGQDAYRRTWEAEAGRQFGLFRDPTQFHVRVRNVKLSGPWPEKLPADLFELKPKEKVTSVERLNNPVAGAGTTAQHECCG
jgi:hypothetical protein